MVTTLSMLHIMGGSGKDHMWYSYNNFSRLCFYCQEVSLAVEVHGTDNQEADESEADKSEAEWSSGSETVLILAP